MIHVCPTYTGHNRYLPATTIYVQVGYLQRYEKV